MNANRIITMLMRLVLRRAACWGMNKGMTHLAASRKSGEPDEAEARAQGRQAARWAVTHGLRLGRARLMFSNVLAGGGGTWFDTFVPNHARSTSLTVG